MSFLEATDKYLKKIETCKSCEEYKELTKTCSICKCIMPIKARLTGNTCPIGKHQ